MLRRPGTKLEKNDKGSGTLITISLVISILIAYTFAASNIAILPYWAFPMRINIRDYWNNYKTMVHLMFWDGFFQVQWLFKRIKKL